MTIFSIFNRSKYSKSIHFQQQVEAITTTTTTTRKQQQQQQQQKRHRNKSTATTMTATIRARSTASKLASSLFQPASRTTPRTPPTLWQPQPHRIAPALIGARSIARAYASYAFAAATQAATTTTSFSSSAPTSSEFDDDCNDENDTGGDHRVPPVSASVLRLRGYETRDTAADTTTNCASSLSSSTSSPTEISVEAATAATYELPSSWLAAETMRDVLNDSYYHASYRATTETTTTAHHWGTNYYNSIY